MQARPRRHHLAIERRPRNGLEQIHEAQTFGCTTARWLETTGYGTLSVPADAITINVR